MLQLGLLLLAAASAGSADDCPDLFGNEEQHESNEKLRSEQIDEVVDGPPYITIYHSADWRKVPRPAEFPKVELITANADGAKLRLLDEHEGCEPGVYRVQTDDSLGDNARIIATLKNVVLIEYEGQLVYLKNRGAPQPVWSLAWTPSWAMNPFLTSRGGGGGGGRVSSAKRSTPKRSPIRRPTKK